RFSCKFWGNDSSGFWKFGGCRSYVSIVLGRRIKMSKVKAAIIGTGNIGTDLMYKLQDSDVIELTAMIGIDPDSDGLKRAKEHGYQAFSNGIEAIQENPELADLVFDATSAKAHAHH